MRGSSWFSSVVVLLGAACSGAQSHEKAPDSAQSEADTPSRPESWGVCMGEPSRRFSFDVSCSAPSECAIEWLPVDCCGSARAVGVSRTAQSELRRAVEACVNGPSCECLPKPTMLDSGEEATDPGDIALECRSGRCSTQLRREPAARKKWSRHRDALVADYLHVVPASQEERDSAERASLYAPEGAPPSPELDWILDEERTSGARLHRWCREQVNFPANRPLEGCHLETLGGGSVLLVTLITECGGDSCSTEGYVMTAALEEFVHVPHDVGGGVDATLAGDALFVTAVTEVALPATEGVEARDPWGGSQPLIASRIALPSMELESFAPCFSPVVSPKGKWIICRDLAANVLKVPLGGGSPVIVATSGLKEGEAYVVWYAYIWPEGVEFVGANRMKFRVVTADGESFERESDWSE